jgi:hypothetical protein
MGNDGNFKTFLARYPRSQLRVVYVTARQEGTNRDEPAAFLVRLRGGQAKVIGLGEVRRSAPEKPPAKQPPEQLPKPPRPVGKPPEKPK